MEKQEVTPRAMQNLSETDPENVTNDSYLISFIVKIDEKSRNVKELQIKASSDLDIASVSEVVGWLESIKTGMIFNEVLNKVEEKNAE